MVGPDALRIVTELYNDNKAEAELNMKMIFTDLGSMNGFLSLLTGSGYLKAIPLEERRWELLPVNREIRADLLDQLVSGRRETDNINEISRAILSGSPEEVRTQLSKSLDAHMDGKLCRDERYYQAFYLGLLNCLTKRYYVKSEYSSGKGNSDIALIPRDGKGPFAILELKDEPGNTGDERMVKVSEGALNQIFDLRYFADLHGELHLYGIATRQKDVFVTYRKIVR